MSRLKARHEPADAMRGRRKKRKPDGRVERQSP